LEAKGVREKVVLVELALEAKEKARVKVKAVLEEIMEVMDFLIQSSQ